MKKLTNLIKQIPFSNALKQNTYDKVDGTLNTSETEVFLKSLKVLLFSAVSFSISLFSAVNWLLFPIVSTITIFLALLFYFQSPNFFKKASYSFVSYFFVQNSFVFYLSFLKITDNVALNRILSSVYILISFVTAFYILRLKLLETIQTKYLFKNQALLKENSMKFVKKLMTILFIFVFVILGFMQVYRYNRWWLMDNDFNFLSGLNGSFMGDVVSIVAVIIGVSVLILVTLLPTLMINSEVIVEGLILKHFSEKFREEYGFKKEDWYGE